MKNILTLFVCSALLTITSCKKDNQIPKPEFADIEFTIYDLRLPGDTTSTDVFYPSTMILKSDYTWSIDLGGAKSNGTYSWTPTSNGQGDINFTTILWTDFTSNRILSDKLKSALLAVRNNGCSIQTGFNNFLVNNYPGFYFPFIRTNKKK
jgi:hypothetical protein